MRYLFLKKNSKERGVSLYLTIVILTILSTVLLTLVGISISQIKVIWTLGDSVVAFYAADSGIEQALYRIRREGNFDNFSDGFSNGASFNVTVTVLPEETTVKSIGSFRDTKRALEAKY